MKNIDGMSDLEAEFLGLCRALGLPEPEREYRFGAMLAGGTGKGLRGRLKEKKLKDWRCDFIWHDERIMVEIEGGVWMGARGGHTNGKDYSDDCDKYNAAQLAGYMVLRFTADMLRDGRAIATLQDARGILRDGNNTRTFV